MAKLSHKGSKRMTTRKRNKIIKKVAEHNRKLRREAKKNPIKKKRKDPGVPNSYPFKDEILVEAEQRKQRAKDLKEAQRASRLKLQCENRELEDLVNDAVVKDRKFEKKSLHREEIDTKSNSSSCKSYFKELKKVVESADVILEVLDARDPIGSRCPQIEEMVISQGKKLVLLLNKIDLIPRSNLDSWLKYLRQELPTVAFKASTQSQNFNLSQSKVAAIHINESLQQSSKCVGAAFLMKILGNYCRNENIQTSIKVGVVGFPNVGKSSVINSLKRSRSCNVGATAGVTKSVQEVSLDKHIRILDSPGVVFAKNGSSTTLALRNAVNVETLKDVISPAEAILQRADHSQLRIHYTLPEFSSFHEFVCLLAKRMGKYKKGGVPNYEEGAKRLINDWNRGIIKYYTYPPEEFKPLVHISSSLVTEMGKAFDISAVDEEMELDKAPGMFPSKGVVTQSFECPEIVMSDQEEMESDVLQNQNVAVNFVEKKSNKITKNESEISVEALQKNKMIKKNFKKIKRNRLKTERKEREKEIEATELNEMM